MKKSKFLTLLSVALVALASCNKETPFVPDDEHQLNLPDMKLLVLNNGSYGKNNSSMTYFFQEDHHLTALPELFKKTNGKGLGDTAQDIIQVGQTYWIAVNVSKTIFVTDLKFKLIKTIKISEEGTELSPRYLCHDGDYVYASLYEGYVARISVVDYAAEVLAVGPNPDQVVASKGKLYVAASGGYLPSPNDKVDVVDLTSFTLVDHLNVNLNPSMLAVNAAGTSLYVYSFGNYSTVPAKVERVDLASGEATDILSGVLGSPVSIAMGAEGRLLILMGGYAADWSPLPGQVYSYDTRKEAFEGSLYSCPVENAYSLSADTKTGYIFVGASDYVNSGDVQVMDKAGKPLGKFDSRGINPIKVIICQ